MSEKRRRYFVETQGMPPMYSGETLTDALNTIRCDIEGYREQDICDGEELRYTITNKNMTDAEVDALPDI